MPGRSRCSIRHRPLDSHVVLPPSSSSSCTYILLSTFLFPDACSKCSWVAVFSPCGVHCSACLAMRSSSVCPSQFYFVLNCACTGSSPVFFHSSVFNILSGQSIFTIFRRHLLIKTCNLPVYLPSFV